MHKDENGALILSPRETSNCCCKCKGNTMCKVSLFSVIIHYIPSLLAMVLESDFAALKMSQFDCFVA